MNKGRWMALSISLFFIAATSGQEKPVLPAPEFQEQIKRPDIQLLDVRTAEEYNAGHIQHSFLADWTNQEQFRERVQYLDKTKTLYVYCGSGVRSSNAGKWLRSNGFQQVFELQNGIIGWKKNKYPLESETSTKQLTKDEYQSIIDTASVVLVDFGAKWCPPCKKMEPVLEQLQRDLQGKFVLRKIDAGTQIEITQLLRVNDLPTFLLYKNSKEVWRKTGLISLEELKTNLEKNF
ncbi:MAG TPA: thioredoxin domain-containing protein [Flavitalea sp.]|nr:thioredoxin domain-containing protein [Flavitalea sp.]